MKGKGLFRIIRAVGTALFLLGSACSGKTPAVHFEKISESLYLVKDVCNVYVVKRGEKALLIDGGDARVLELMSSLGIRKIDWVLQTHSHRDQCQGTPRLVDAGARVAVPEKEKRFFADAAGFWNDFEIYYRYRYKPDQFKPRENIAVQRTLSHGERLKWEGLRFEAVETPGHTVGSVTYLAEIDGRRCAFTGDMIHSPGKVWNLYSFDHRYWDGGYRGIVANLEGLDRVLAKNPQVLLPSHGIPMPEPAAAVEMLKANLEKLYDFEPEEEAQPQGGPRRRIRSRPWRKVTEHLYHYRPTSFILLSQDSSALFYDYYAVPDTSNRYYYDSLDEVLDSLGIKTVELAIPSHFHEDHIRGFLDLKQRFGTSVWVYENMVDILENPGRYNLPCLAEESIPADRTLHPGETIRWKEYEFTVVHFPGQTMYHQGMAGTVDGKKVFFCGDTDVYELDNPNLTHRSLKLHGISTFLNFYLLEPDRGFIKALDQLVRHDPELLLFAHSGARPGNSRMYLENRETVKQRIAIVAQVLPYENPNFGFDPNWVCFYPYSTTVKPGDQSVGAKSEAALAFRVSIPESAVLNERTVITADVKTQGRDWGELAEMLLERE